MRTRYGFSLYKTKRPYLLPILASIQARYSTKINKKNLLVFTLEIECERSSNKEQLLVSGVTSVTHTTLAVNAHDLLSKYMFEWDFSVSRCPDVLLVISWCN